MNHTHLTKGMVACAYYAGIIKIVSEGAALGKENPSDFGPVIQFGEKGFFTPFPSGIDEKVMTVSEFMKKPIDDIIEAIYDAIEPYHYCVAYIVDHLAAEPYIGKTLTFTSTTEGLACHDGEVFVRRKLRPDECDEADTGPMYEVKSVADDAIFDAFEDELTSPVDFDSIVRAINGSFPMDNKIHFARDEDGIIMFCPNAASVTLMKTSAEVVALFITAITKKGVTVSEYNEADMGFRIVLDESKT